MKYICSLAIIFLLISCSTKPDKTSNPEVSSESVEEEKQEFVLAQWTFNKALFSGEMTTVDFVNKASEMGFVGVEYVNQFFKDEIDNDLFFKELNAAAQKARIKNTLIMVDIKEAKLGASDEDNRRLAIDIHKKWIKAASKLDCPNIRVNAFGDGTSQEIMDACFESIKELSSYGKKYRVGVIVENHGQYSSDGKWLSTLVGKLMPYGVGSLADFDNWCIEREGGEMYGSPCINEYDKYQGMKELLPTAKSVSLKAFEFDQNGNAIRTDFKKMFEIIKASQYDGYLAVEFEGEEMDPEEGVKKTLKLVKSLL